MFAVSWRNSGYGQGQKSKDIKDGLVREMSQGKFSTN